MKILITGSSGQLGSFLLEHFSNRYEALGLDRVVPKIDPLKPITRIGDMLDFESVKEIIKDMDVVVHCAAQVSVNASVKDPFFDAENNILGTLRALVAARDCNVGKFIYISSAAVYGNPEYLPIDEKHPTRPMSPYGLSKLAGEKYALLFNEVYGLNSVAIRPFNIYSERQDPSNPYTGVISKFIDRAKSGKPAVVFGDGNQTRDFIHIQDVVKLIDLVVKKDVNGEVFNCATGIRTTINRLAEVVNDVYGNDLEPLHGELPKGDIRHSYASIESAKEKLGFAPDISLEKGLRMMKDCLI